MKTPSIVLAAFGVSNPAALEGILNIVHHARQVFPNSQIRLAFTSNQIRKKWQRRADDFSWRQANPHVPEEVLAVQGPLAAIANLQDAGHNNIVVQSLHVYAGEEYFDLKSHVDGLNSIRTAKPRWMPFSRLVLGRPALGAPGIKHPYREDLKRAAGALEADVREAREKRAALVYVGHGNHHYSTGVYHELQLLLQQQHPDVRIEIGAVEGMFGSGYVAGQLRGASVRRVLIKPLMVVAGVHARDDMAGNDEDSWRSVLSEAGFEVECSLQGLGETKVWADIYVDHIFESAADVGLELPRQSDVFGNN